MEIGLNTYTHGTNVMWLYVLFPVMLMALLDAVWILNVL